MSYIDVDQQEVSGLGQAPRMQLAIKKPLMTRPAGLIQPSGRITGIVVDAGGAPVAGASFTVDNVPMTGGRGEPFVTGADGVFLIGRAAGLRDVTINAPGAQPMVLKGVEFVSGSMVDLGPITVGLGAKSAGALGGTSVWTIAAIVSGSVVVLGLLGFVGWKLYKRRKGATSTIEPEAAAPAVSDYLCDRCHHVTPAYGP